MGLVGGELGYRVLTWIGGQKKSAEESSGDIRSDKLRSLFGSTIFQHVRGKTVIDFGCGFGHQCVELAKHGAARVIGIDNREAVLSQARHLAQLEGVASICHFTHKCDEKAEVIVSIDSFEHFRDPAEVLTLMSELLVPSGAVWISFGPTWYHPKGGHLFSVFPWAHLIFTESALIRWRSRFKDDGALKFEDVDGGLNKMTIKRFKRIVNESEFFVENLKLVPIRPVRYLWTPQTCEFFTSVVQCQLRKRDNPPNCE